MTYARNFLRLTASGTLMTYEGWSWGLSFIRTTPGAAAPTEVPAAVRNAVQTFMSTVATNAAKMNLIKLNEIGTTGKYVRQVTVLHDYAATPHVPPAASTIHAPQVALAVSLMTNQTRGLASSGRFFIPSPRATINTGSGQMPDTDRDTVLTGATTLLNSLNGAIPGWRVGVVSDGGKLKETAGSGVEREVRAVRVGKVLDTIRSRRTAIPEAYLAGPEVAGYTGATFGGGGGDF